MSDNLPFGFGNEPERGGEGGSGGPMDFFAQLGQFGGMSMFGDLQRLLTGSGGPVNWELAGQLAESALQGANPGVAPAERTAVAEAIRLGDLWLDPVTDLPSGVQSIETWTRLEWLQRTTPVWRSLCDPVAERVVAAMGSAIPTEQMGGVLGAGLPLAGIMNQVGGLMFGAQVGQGLAGLAREVVGATDVGIPLGPNGVAALVPANVAVFGEGLERPADEVRLYLALREAAHQRLFTHVPWLRQRLLAAVDAYARGITVDLSSIEQAMGSIDPTNPESVQEALAGGMFEPQTTPEQQAALRRLETILALVEGWVDSVVAAAAADRMPGAEALREASRRRRAAGGPAEQTFATLVGLELRPRRLREAAALWWSVTEKHGISGRDGLWAHPDLMPGADDLDDPLGFADSMSTDSSAAGFSAAEWEQLNAGGDDPDEDRPPAPS